MTHLIFENSLDLSIKRTMIIVRNKKNEVLGAIKYYPKWKEAVWLQEDGVQMSTSCIKELTKEMESFEEIEK